MNRDIINENVRGKLEEMCLTQLADMSKWQT